MHKILHNDGHQSSLEGSVFSDQSSESDSFMLRQTKKNIFTVATINARSIKAKLDSFKKKR